MGSISRKKRFGGGATVLATSFLATIAITSPASALTNETMAGENLYNNETCYSPHASRFKFHIWYNSGMGGSYRNIGYPVYDFNALRPGNGHAYPLKFCKIGASNPWPGSGQNIKNNAASGENEHYKYTARVYYSSGYKGVQDVMAPYQHISRFVNVYNENASFRWT
ncbi:hypothetical protein G6045_05775 [Streptomyces sp. YC504]|uniref:Uncharacterized protein n=1 Tax=Streptomyces mesophilus TaxID=1775132 RepID=A0A6G4XEP8_9ACTN|nr:hypothetical protein [Streptomyces mesophilus]NGO75194.1 hypothetical protein [Streptomyces mesophilus]